jgi:hypothetical protein
VLLDKKHKYKKYWTTLGITQNIRLLITVLRGTITDYPEKLITTFFMRLLKTPKWS